MSRNYVEDERSPNGVVHSRKLHRVACDLCDAFVERQFFPQRPSPNGRTDVGYIVPAGHYFTGTAGDPAPFALLGWAAITVVRGKASTDRSEIEGYDVDVEVETIDVCPRHVGDFVGLLNRVGPKQDTPVRRP